MTAKIHSIDTIIADPNIRNGRPIVRGTTICVSDVAVIKIFHQKDADEVAEWFNLPLEDVYAALSYYYSHKTEIDAEIEERNKLAEEFKAKRVGSRHDPLLS